MADFDPHKYVSPTMTEEDVIALKEVFDALDTSGDGKIERSELTSAILTMGIPMHEVTGGSIRELTHGPDGASSVMDFDTFVRVIVKGQEKAGATNVRTNRTRNVKGPGGKWAAKGCLTWED